MFDLVTALVQALVFATGMLASDPPKAPAKPPEPVKQEAKEVETTTPPPGLSVSPAGAGIGAR